MTYRVKRERGYQPWGITNPWVYADLSQPQRLRGSVSPMVFQTRPPSQWNRTLPMAVGEVAEADPVARAEARSARMERWAIAGVTISAISLALFVHQSGALRALVKGGRVAANRRRRRR